MSKTVGTFRYAEKAWARKGAVGLNYGVAHQKNKDVPWTINPIKFGDLEVPIISLFYFPDPKHLGWEGFQAQFEIALNAPVVIVDLRGNRGGDDTKAFEIAKRLIGDRFQTPQKLKKTRVTAAARAIFLNSVIAEIHRYKTSGKVIPSWLNLEEKTRRENYFRAKLNLNADFETYHFPTLPISHQLVTYSNPIIVLIDADCGSTGELLILALKGQHNVTVVGENSAGFLHFGNAGLFILPHSQIAVEMPTTYKIFRKTGWFEQAGISPDVSVPAGGEALEWAKSKVLPTLVKK